MICRIRVYVANHVGASWRGSNSNFRLWKSGPALLQQISFMERRRILAKFSTYYNGSRPHVSLGKDAPNRRPISSTPKHGKCWACRRDRVHATRVTVQLTIHPDCRCSNLHKAEKDWRFSRAMPKIGGQMQLYFSTLSGSIEYIKTNQLRALAVGSSTMRTW
jgi:hypothetical protein